MDEDEMISNPIDEAIDVLDDVLSWGDTPSHIIKNASVAMSALLTLKSTHVIIPKGDLPEGLREAYQKWNTRADQTAEMQAAIVELREALFAITNDTKNFIGYPVYEEQQTFVLLAEKALENTKKWGDQ